MADQQRFKPGMRVRYCTVRRGDVIREHCTMTIRSVGKRWITIDGDRRYRFRLDGSSTDPVYRDRAIVPVEEVVK